MVHLEQDENTSRQQNVKIELCGPLWVSMVYIESSRPAEAV